MDHYILQDIVNISVVLVLVVTKLIPVFFPDLMLITASELVAEKVLLHTKKEVMTGAWEASFDLGRRRAAMSSARKLEAIAGAMDKDGTHPTHGPLHKAFMKYADSERKITEDLYIKAYMKAKMLDDANRASSTLRAIDNPMLFQQYGGATSNKELNEARFI